MDTESGNKSGDNYSLSADSFASSSHIMVGVKPSWLEY